MVAAGTPSLSTSEVIRLKHLAKVFIRDISSTPMSTGELLFCCPRAVHMLLPCPQVMLMPCAASEEIYYRRIAQSAISDMTLVSDRQILEPFASTNIINECPDFATIDSVAKENEVHIPQLHQALANALGATVGVVNCCSTFEVNSRNVVNSHNIETIGHLRPDIVVVDKRYESVDTFRCLTMSPAHELPRDWTGALCSLNYHMLGCVYCLSIVCLMFKRQGTRLRCTTCTCLSQSSLVSKV